MIKITSLESTDHIRGRIYLVELSTNRLPPIREELSALLLGEKALIDGNELVIIGLEYFARATTHSLVGLLTKKQIKK